MLKKSKKTGLYARLSIYFWVYLLGYFRYVIATPAIVQTVGAFLLVIMVLSGGNLSALFDVMPALSGLLPEQIQLNEAALLEIYLTLSLVFGVLSAAGKALIKFTFKKPIALSFKTKLKAVLIFLTACYVILMAGVPFLAVAEESHRLSFFIIFLLMYAGAIFAVVVAFYASKAIGLVQDRLLAETSVK